MVNAHVAGEEGEQVAGKEKEERAGRGMSGQAALTAKHPSGISFLFFSYFGL